MVKSCCVKECTTSWYPKSELSFFSFPLNNRDLLNEWLEVVPTKNRISKNSRICSNHFEESQYEYISGKRHLKKDAIPSIFSQDITNFKTIINEVEKLYPTSHVVLEKNEINDNSNNDHCYTKQQQFLAYVSLPSSISDATNEATSQTRSVYTQTSPRATEKEKELRQQIKILQSRLCRKERKILGIYQLLKHMKKNCKCKSSNR
ncbi:PREDICTED: THAP domain-containing protein 1-like [Wasmannia auropunctata]|uniref:THAP domain-containing protein 1-like n=1 Tax=Wasmannia auropunctata TaxID=64793 RepID=UPI0005EF246C|nr:PREDICTED: THAP domain-containing protein 1-like [Wasmannia auropunctata]XP_011699831.1 PREDICTED: THAP domain-containing protein 1-like [Wasmannia auropunctata]